MMDLWATVPYYTAYLSRALLDAGVAVQIGSITYYLDPECFSRRGLRLRPGCSNVVGRMKLPRTVRRVLKLAEGLVNLAALALRFAFKVPDIVHVQFLPLLRSRIPVDLWFLRFCKRRGAKLVLTVHDLLPHDTGEHFKQLYRNLYAEMDLLICHSTHVQNRLASEFEVPRSKISVIPHGPFFYDLPARSETSTPNFLGVQPGQGMVLWQGILFPYKGVDLLLAAWREVEIRTDALDLVILGTGDPVLLESLQRQARELGLQRVHFEFRFCTAEELVAAYRTAAVVVYPYRAITTSGALATGLSLGKAIVASDLPVFRELLTDEENALLVDPHSPEQLAKAVIRVATGSELRGKLSAAVREMRFGEQSWGDIANATAAVYQHVLQ